MDFSTDREESIVRLVLERPPTERVAFLEQACGDDTALRQRVESLLLAQASRKQTSVPQRPENGPSSHAKLSTTGWPLAEGQATVLDSQIEPLPVLEKPGVVIGRYKLREQLGEGGCGVVYLAEQEEPVRRRVALKLIKLGMDTKSVIARFDAERQALAMMEHPNIAKVLDAGATETGRPYFVMELARGIKITDYCEENKLSIPQRLDLFVKVCQAVQHAHQKGIIHRDLKPSNILVTMADGAPVPKVIDFGIAKATAGRLSELTIHTEFQQLIGTPAYMSPEQAGMSGLDIDTRSDIYSLGVLLYELLTGRTPFDAKELVRTGLEEMRRILREREPLRPSVRLRQELTETDPGRQLGKPGAQPLKTEHEPTSSPRQLQERINRLRGDLDWIVMKCLEKDRTRRYETANGLAMDIQRFLGSEPVVARPPSTSYRLRKSIRRNKFAFAAAAAVSAVLVLGVVTSTWQAVRAIRAEQKEIRLREEAQHAQATEATLRQLAETQELITRRKAYASDMNLAQQALAANNRGRAQDLLDRNRPGHNNPLAGAIAAQAGHSGPRVPSLAAVADLRGWEWRYLWQQCQSDAQYVLCQQTNSITSLAVSQDGRWLAIGEQENGALSIWDLPARQEIARLPAGEGYVLAAFSPVQPLLAFSYATDLALPQRQDGVCFWDAASRQLSRTKLALSGECRGLAFAADGRKLLTAATSPGHQLTIWSVPEGKELQSEHATQSTTQDTTAFAATPDLSLAAYGDFSDPASENFKKIRLVDLATGKERWHRPTVQIDLAALAFSPDGKVLASVEGYLTSPIRLWDTASGKQIASMEGHQGWVAALMFRPDGKVLASASGDQTIRLWDVSQLPKVPPPRILRGHRLEVWRLAWLPDNKTLVSGSKDGSVLVWDTTSPQREQPQFTLPEDISNWTFTADSQGVVTADSRGRLIQWRGHEFQQRLVLMETGERFEGHRTVFSRDGQWLASGSPDGAVTIWNLSQRAQVRQFETGLENPSPAQFLAQNRSLVIVDERDGSHHEWNLATGQLLRSWPGAGKKGWRPGSTAFSLDERWCVMFSSSGATRLRDLVTGQESEPNLDMRKLLGVAFSPDGKLLAAASEWGFARLWETATRRELATLRGFLQSVNSVAWSPDSRRLAIGSDEKEAIKLWEAESQEELLTLEGTGSSYRQSAFSPDGNILGSRNSNGILHLWRASSWAEVQAADRKQEVRAR